MAKQVDLTTNKEVPLDPKVVKIIKDEPVSMDDFVKSLDEDEETTCKVNLNQKEDEKPQSVGKHLDDWIDDLHLDDWIDDLDEDEEGESCDTDHCEACGS